MSFSIRDAEPADMAAITEIYANSVLNGTATYELTPPDLDEMTRRFMAMSSAGYPYIVAEEDGQLLGYAYAGPFRTRPAYRWTVEDSIYLDPIARGKGIGFSLLNELILRATQLGFRQMIAIIGGGEPGSIALHKKAGFKDCGAMHATGYKHNRWLDTVIMQLDLGEGSATSPDADRYPGNLYKA